MNPDLFSCPEVSRCGVEAFGIWVQMLLWAAGWDTTVVPAILLAHVVLDHDRHLKALETVGFIRRKRDDILVLSPPIGGRGKPAWTVVRNRTHIHPTVRAAVLARDGHRCVLCPATNDLTLDHIHPWSKGGADTLDNLRTLCRSCNSAKRDRTDGP